MRNLITDGPGVKVGNTRDAQAATGYATSLPDYRERFGG